jgi:[ribosomal protein S18]-alanine N-acetyltransferase
VIVRAMEPRDIDAALAIQAASPEIAQWNASDYDLSARPGILGLIAEQPEDRRFAGFLVARQVLDECEILNLAVAPASRRRGVATSLLRALLESATRRGTAAIYLEVRASNAAARAFYERNGFREIARRTNYYNFPIEDALVLELPLRPR